jgi:hypothetical protein
MAPALTLIEQGLLHPEIVTSQVVSWDDTAEALPDLDGKTVVSRDTVSSSAQRGAR